MTEGNGQASAAVDPFAGVWRPWLDLWTEMLDHRSDWMQAVLAGSPADADPRQVRKRWLDALSKSIEAYLRTPAFLDAMRRNFDAMTALKTTSELAKREATRQAGMPYVEDIAGLYERLQTGQEALLARLAAIDQRLHALDQRFAALEKQVSESGGSSHS